MALYYSVRLSASSLLFKGERSPPQGPIVCRTQEKKKTSRQIGREEQCLRWIGRVIMTKIKRREEENRWIIKVEDGQVEEGD